MSEHLSQSGASSVQSPQSSTSPRVLHNLPSSALLPSLCARHTDLLTVPSTCQAQPCLGVLHGLFLLPDHSTNIYLVPSFLQVPAQTLYQRGLLATSPSPSMPFSCFISLLCTYRLMLFPISPMRGHAAGAVVTGADVWAWPQVHRSKLLWETLWKMPCSWALKTQHQPITVFLSSWEAVGIIAIFPIHCS